MKYTVKCPFCNQRYELDEFKEGQEAECENCHRSFTICMAVLDVSVKHQSNNNNATTIEQNQNNARNIKSTSPKTDNPNVNPVEDWLINGKQNQSENNIPKSGASPVENWLGSKLGNHKKSEMEKNNQGSDENEDENWLADWQKSIKPNQMNKNDLGYFNSINYAIDIWIWAVRIIKILLIISLPISAISICYIFDNYRTEFCQIWVPIILIAEIQLIFIWLFSLFLKVVLESLREMNYNAKVIVTAITNLKEK